MQTDKRKQHFTQVLNQAMHQKPHTLMRGVTHSESLDLNVAQSQLSQQARAYQAMQLSMDDLNQDELQQ